MDVDKGADSIAELRRRVLELTENGHKSGLSRAEITTCISQALKDSTRSSTAVDDHSDARKGAVSTAMASFHRWRGNVSMERFSRRQKSVMVVAALVVVLSVTVMIDPFNRPISRLVQFLFDKGMRLIRLAALPIHRVANISAYHYSECIVSNPLYSVLLPSCGMCRRFNEVKTTNSTHVRYLLRIPMLYKGVAGRTVSLTDVQNMVLANRKALDLPTMQFRSTVPWMKSAVDLGQSDLKEKIMTHRGFHSEWFTRELLAARLIRQLFPRPPFVSVSAEVCLERSLMLDGPGAQSYFPRQTHCPNSVFVVGDGLWEAWLHPPPSCSSECHPLQVLLEPRDMLAFPTERYTLEVKPGEGVGVAVLISSN